MFRMPVTATMLALALSACSPADPHQQTSSALASGVLLPAYQQWLQAGDATRDPVWRMPLWRPYLRYLSSGIADLANAGSRMAGSVTAALYLERFLEDGQRWAHLDVYAWNDGERPGRPAGGEALALRSAWAMLKQRYS